MGMELSRSEDVYKRLDKADLPKQPRLAGCKSAPGHACADVDRKWSAKLGRHSMPYSECTRSLVHSFPVLPEAI
jgi:hypothetical protein